MDNEFSLWFCYVKVWVGSPDEIDSQWKLTYCSIPAKAFINLVGFEIEKIKIIAIFNFHPINSCALKEVDEPEQIKALTKVLMVEDNLYNFSIWAMLFIKKINWVAYYGFDVETVMEIAANKQVDIIIVNTGYGGKYSEVDWMKNIRMLKSNPETAQIPVILKGSPGDRAGDRERYLAISGADDTIRVEPGGMNSLVEKIKQTLSARDSNLNTTIDSKKRFSGSQTVRVQKESELLNFIGLKIYQIMIMILFIFYQLGSAISRRYESFKKGGK